MSLRVLGRGSSANVQKVIWLLDEMGVAYRREDYGGGFGGNAGTEFLRLNPNGRVPVLLDGATVVWESNTILRYLANRFGPTPFYPSAPAARSEVERWMDWQLGTLGPVMTSLYIALIRTAPVSRNVGEVARDQARANELFALLDSALAKSDYIAGSSLTLADICNAVLAYRWYILDIERTAPTLNLWRWFQAVAQRPSFARNVAIALS